jgi:shikimate dehydrogenase
MMEDGSPIYHLGLIGWPLDHSLSAPMHTAALESLNLAGDYRLFPVPPLPEGNSQLIGLIEKVRCGKIHGLNVTIPHKQNVLNLMDTLSPAAKTIGAVNTVSLQGGFVHGDNTDWLGFLHDLDERLSTTGINNLKRALVLGAGGSARAVVYALLQSGWKVTISSRRLEQAQKLAADFSNHQLQIKTGHLSQFPGLSETTLIVNTTPLGMLPEILSNPWPSESPFPPNAFVYDLVYNPPETTLMQAAASAGLESANGLGMLIEQAALAFEIWTGLSAKREVFRRAALERKPV